MIKSINIIKKVSTAIVLMCISFVSFSQEAIKYEDLIAEIPRLTPKQRYYRFFQYQRQDPLFSNTYIQLGDACEKIFQTLDPLREFQQLNYWTGNAILYYGLFPVYLKSGEVRRNREYYSNFNIESQGRRIENEDAIAYVRSRVLYCNNYKDTITSIFNALEKSKDSYNNCVKIFNEINERYDNLNEALLQTNDNVLAQLEKLEVDFKSAVNEFNYYRKTIDQFPIGDYNQSYELLPIQTFRLDGLTNSDFLKNSFTLWDYGTWVSEFRQTYNTDIVALRNDINAIQRQFNNNRRRLTFVESMDEEEKFKSYDDLFMFRLGKYDNNS